MEVWAPTGISFYDATVSLTVHSEGTHYITFGSQGQTHGSYIASLSNKNGNCYCTTEGPDGYLDLVLKFDTQEIVAALGTVYDGDELPLILTSEDLAETPIEVTDCIITIANNEN